MVNACGPDSGAASRPGRAKCASWSSRPARGTSGTPGVTPGTASLEVAGAGRSAYRELPRDQHPDLGKPALVVDLQLAAAYVRAVVHLQHHVGQRVRLHVDPRPRQAHPLRVQVEYFVRLYQPAQAPRRVAPHQACSAEAPDPRPPEHLDPRRHLHQPPGRPFMVGGRVGNHPRGLGEPVPELEAPLVVLERALRQAKRTCSRESPPARTHAPRRPAAPRHHPARGPLAPGSPMPTPSPCAPPHALARGTACAAPSPIRLGRADRPSQRPGAACHRPPTRSRLKLPKRGERFTLAEPVLPTRPPRSGVDSRLHGNDDG